MPTNFAVGIHVDVLRKKTRNLVMVAVFFFLDVYFLGFHHLITVRIHGVHIIGLESHVGSLTRCTCARVKMSRF